MKIRARYRAHLADITAIGEESLEASSVNEVLKHIKKSFGSMAEKTARAMIIAVNGQNILQLKVFKTPLQDGDEVSFVPICGGG
jgi:molybdopterin converting factor small subunit